MHIKFIYRSYIVVFLLLASQALSEISLIELRGLSTCMQPEYAQLAPAYGALYWYSPYVRNLYTFGDAKSATVQLAKRLFHVHVDGSFDVTHSATKIAHYFEPKDIGNIIGVIYKNKDNFQQIEAEITQITKHVFNDKKETIKPILVKNSQDTIDRQLAAILQLENDILPLVPADRKFLNRGVDPVEFRQEWKNFFRELHQTLKLDMKQVNKLIRKITDITIKYAIKSKLPLLQSNCIRLSKNMLAMQAEQKSPEPINEFLLADAGIKRNKEPSFAHIVAASIEEEQQQLYPPENTVYLLLAWLWKHSNSRIDAKQYLDSLAQTIQILPEQLYTPLIQEVYTGELYDNLTHKSAEQISKLALEDLIFAQYGFELYKNVLPPLVSMIDGVEYRDPQDNFLSPPGGYPDCGETSLRNFFNTLLYASKPHEFIGNILEKMNAHQLLIDFYKKYSTADKINTKDAHNDWSQVVSGLPNGNYLRSDVCEIAAGIRNMLNIIAALIPGTTSFDQLADHLMKKNITMKIAHQHPLDNEQYDKNNVIKITITKPSGQPFQLSWKFEPKHFQMGFPPLATMTHQQKFHEGLSTYIGQTDPLNQWPFVMLYAAFGASYEQTLQVASTITYVPYNVLLLLPKTPDGRVDMTKLVIQAINKEQDPKKLNTYQEMILFIHKDLPRDFLLLEKFFNNILSSLTTDNIPLIQKLLKEQKDEKGRAAYISAVLNKPIPVEEAERELLKYFYKEAIKILPTIQGDTSQIMIIRIFNKLVSNGEAKRTLLKPFYEWASNNLVTIRNGIYKRILIQRVLDKPIPADEAEKTLLKPFYEWASNTLPTIQNNQIKSSLIEQILNQQIPTDEVGKALLKPLYEYVVQELPKLPSHYQKDIIQKLLSIEKTSAKDILLQEQWEKVYEMAK